MNELQIFDSPEFGKIRTVEIDGRPYFVGADVAKALGYVKTRNALSRHCRGGLFQGVPTYNQHGTEVIQQMTVIPEGDLYRLIINSKLPTAEKFERWVLDEVLPSIRKHGAYMTPARIEEALLNPDTIIKLATQLKEERAERERLQIVNSELKQEAASLHAENAILADAATEWNNRAILNALVRAYANDVLNCDFQRAWNTFYKRFNYTAGVNLKNRKVESKSISLIERIRDNEWNTALQVAIGMCHEKGIQSHKIIGENNLRKIEGSNQA